MKKVVSIIGVSCMIFVGAVYCITNKKNTANKISDLFLQNMEVLARGESGVNPDSRYCFQYIYYYPEYGFEIYNEYYCGSCRSLPVTDVFDSNICFVK